MNRAKAAASLPQSGKQFWPIAGYCFLLPQFSLIYNNLTMMAASPHFAESSNILPGRFLKTRQTAAALEGQIGVNERLLRKGRIMKKERRWLKSAIAASADLQVVLPWARDQRRRPAAMKSLTATVKPRAIAAR